MAKRANDRQASTPVGKDGPHHPAFARESPETLQRLRIYAELLKKWNPTINLVGPKTLDQIWIRHFADSLQVSDALPEARRWMDLGSGAGFPGLVTAIRYADDPQARVHLLESDQRKCAFLREVSRETGAPATICCERIEKFLPSFHEPIEAVSARALAPLPILLRYAENLIAKGAIGVFSKGEHAEAELTDSFTASKYLITTMESRTCASARLVIVRRRPDLNEDRSLDQEPDGKLRTI
ncbi:16S rRNA (guanine(527)-N(7))-methyltransferase RsmG [Methylocapsa acidiphila]|uniref:16S rRNA (guanine(527)-N(7))-methyltransferase RsmG n=1 Tax=Methylocapsa acidiphila TaxID=133552 RepID=UPI0004127201|nr:16S rRNA (guanine(527)-N(7))-methyltransferase RsmG [Methylocapsa acidiphila]